MWSGRKAGITGQSDKLTATDFVPDFDTSAFVLEMQITSKGAIAVVDVDIVGEVSTGAVAATFVRVIFDADHSSATYCKDLCSFWCGKVYGIDRVAFVGQRAVVSLRDGDLSAFLKGHVDPESFGSDALSSDNDATGTAGFDGIFRYTLAVFFAGSVCTGEVLFGKALAFVLDCAGTTEDLFVERNTLSVFALRAGTTGKGRDTFSPRKLGVGATFATGVDRNTLSVLKHRVLATLLGDGRDAFAVLKNSAHPANIGAVSSTGNKK